MIIKLTGADFSANNIGKVDVRTELSAFTKAAITASGNTTMTEVQQWGLEAFFDKIGATTNTGVFSKLQFLCIPYIAGGLEQSLVDYKDNSVIGVPDATSYAMVEHGIKAITSTNASPIKIDGKYNFKHDSYSVLFAITSANDLASGNITKLLTIGIEANERYDVRVVRSSNGLLNLNTIEGTGTTWGNTICSNLERISNTAAFVKKDDSVKLYRPDAGTPSGTFSGAATVNESNKLALFSGIDQKGNNSNSLPIGLLAAGDYLTDEEVESFRTAANELKDLFIK